MGLTENDIEEIIYWLDYIDQPTLFLTHDGHYFTLCPITPLIH